MRILVTGTTGFLGSALIPMLVRNFGADSLSAYVLPGDRIPESWKDEKVRIIYGDITDKERVLEAVNDHTHVVHLAGLISYWRRDFHRLMRVNWTGTRFVVEACLKAGVRRLVHVSSVGAVGFRKRGELIDEETPFNWPPYFHYMCSKHLGQRVVEEAARRHGLNAVIFNPASIMGPGDPVLDSPHNQLYARVYGGLMFGSFRGGLGVVDVRDVSAFIIKGLGSGRAGEKYLLVGANLHYSDVLELIGKHARRPVYPFPVPASLLSAAGICLELVSYLTRKKPLLTYAYGRISGWTTFYTSEKSRREFSHTYIPIDETIWDSLRYFEKTFISSRPRKRQA